MLTENELELGPQYPDVGDGGLTMSTQMDLATPAKRPQLLRVCDVAQLLNVKPRTIYEMVAQDRIPYRKPPGQTFSVLISKKFWNGRAEKTNALRDRCCYHAARSLGGCNLKENTMSVYKRGKGTHWHYYFRVRGVRYRGALSEARTKWEAEQAETKIKQEIFEGRFGKLDLGSEKLADFIERVFVPWSKANKRSWKHDEFRARTIREYFGGKPFARFRRCWLRI